MPGQPLAWCCGQSAGRMRSVFPNPLAHNRGFVDSPGASSLSHSDGLFGIEVEDEILPLCGLHKHRAFDCLEFILVVGEIVRGPKGGQFRN